MIPKEQPQREPPTKGALEALLANGLQDAVQQMIEVHELKYKIEGDKLVDIETGAQLWLKKFVTEDKDTLDMKADALKLSKVSDEILITGETGTGKEIIARAMIGDREGRFCRINCAALPEGLIESELFGSVRGSYTGSVGDKQGLIRAAANGIMFLDEIGDLSAQMQAKLLNVLQPIDGKRYTRPVGSTEEIEISCRFICATHRDLRKMINDNLFRRDLYARISTFELKIKPLRERKTDIPIICKCIGETLKISSIKIQEFLDKYEDDYINGELDLSLNVRSLEQAIKRYVILGKI